MGRLLSLLAARLHPEESCQEQEPFLCADLCVRRAVAELLRHHRGTHGPQSVGRRSGPAAADVGDGWHVRDDAGDMDLQGGRPEIMKDPL